MTTPVQLDDNHVYHAAGRVVPGVTSVIRGCAPGFLADEFYLQRGQAVHKAIHLYFERRLDWDTVDTRIRGRVESIIKFVHDEGFTPVLLEHKLFSERYQYAGTLDAYGTNKRGDRTLCDWKGSLSPHCEVQLGAYYELLSESGDTPVDAAVAVACKDDGTYKCQWYTYRQLKRASQIFTAMLTVQTWRERNHLD